MLPEDTRVPVFLKFSAFKNGLATPTCEMTFVIRTRMFAWA